MLRGTTLLVLMLSLTSASAQERSSADMKWTDKNNTEQYAAYLISNAYAESGHCIAAVDIKNVGTVRQFTVNPGQLCRISKVTVVGLHTVLQHTLMEGGPKEGEVYFAGRVNEFVREVKHRYARDGGPLSDVTWGMRLDHEHGQVFLQLDFIERH
jgi:outer membrane protein assembly factor BamA